MQGQDPIKISVSQRLRDFSGTPLTVAVWFAASILLLYMLAGRAGSFEYVGLARALQYEISSTTGGTLDALLVDVYQAVDKGQAMARLDDAELVARLETARAVLDQIAAELGAEPLRVGLREARLVDDRRRFQVDEQRLHLDVLSLRVVIESDQIELERLSLRLDRARPLAEEGILSENEYDDLRLARERLARRLEENRRLLREIQEELRVSSSRREAYERQFPDLTDKDPVLRPLKDAVRAQELRIEEIEIQRRALTLRSPVTGRVSQVLARNGQSVLPGEPLMFVVENTASEIVAYAPEDSADRIVERSRVATARQRTPSVVAESIITRVGPSIEQLPLRMWRDPGIPEYGRPFVVAGVPALKLTPGEMVEIRVIEP